MGSTSSPAASARATGSSPSAGAYGALLAQYDAEAWSYLDDWAAHGQAVLDIHATAHNAASSPPSTPASRTPPGRLRRRSDERGPPTPDNPSAKGPMRPGFSLTRTSDQHTLVDVCPGVRMLPLAMTDPHQGAPLPISALVWFEPGAEVTDDHHADSTEINHVLAGQLRHDDLDLGPGDVLICARGTTHSPHSPPHGPGAVLYVTFPDRQHHP
ncbi:hypothetical protein RM572_27765 [Streptomyces sp. DSM 42041]|uniref:ChrR-like cupin domain-containing protein n=1 Tax=Streptomyces hazeniae TaxID=3075538 RepID=A0ABU2NZZ5_9ACTN|nr:hypothetical protein [Streptomyces sp. DSM 42041]MDT0382560.1 hypothetical protein [Streptomyces sp. DSM 42041]